MMNTLRNMLDAQEIHCRAAEVRRRWTDAEKRRRAGLPPDTPPRLRDYILGGPKLGWQLASCDPRSAR